MDAVVALPARWRQDRQLLGDRARWTAAEAEGDDEGLLLAITGPRRSVLLGRGAPARVAELVATRAQRHADAGAPAVGWMNVPRGTLLPDDVLATLGLSRFSSWDWLSTDVVPTGRDDAGAVVRLDAVRELDAIRDCLAEANPGTSANPEAPEEVGWWGVRDPAVAGRLLGVIGAARRGGRRDGEASWHLHGLGVRPSARGRGLGEALTTVATAEGLAAGCPWVSLAMYADNERARRIYHRLGFATEVELDSYGPAGATRPPA